MGWVVILKLVSVSLALLGGGASVYARSLSPHGAEDPDRIKRGWYLVSYALTSASIIVFAAIGFM